MASTCQIDSALWGERTAGSTATAECGIAGATPQVGWPWRCSMCTFPVMIVTAALFRKNIQRRVVGWDLINISPSNIFLKSFCGRVIIKLVLPFWVTTDMIGKPIKSMLAAAKNILKNTVESLFNIQHLKKMLIRTITNLLQIFFELVLKSYVVAKSILGLKKEIVCFL